MKEVKLHPYFRALIKKVRLPYYLMALLQKFQVPSLPCEVILEILSRLPIESLIRCKIVCKNWCNLIKDPLFIELQLRRSMSRPRLIICGDHHWRIVRELYLLDVSKIRKRMMWKARKISLKYNSYEDKNEIFDVHIIGSCNGLICKISEFPHRCCGVCHNICICNPISKECVVLPLRSGLTYLDSSIFGFGVDSTGKYKVIRIFHKDGMFKGEIITVGQSNSWRELDFPYQLYHSIDDPKIRGMLFMDGVLYCMFREPINQQQMILLFDIHDEKFSTIELPPSMKFPYCRDLVLTVIKDSLVLYEQRRLCGVSLWMTEINKSKDGLSVYQSMDMPWPNIDGCFIDMVGMLSYIMLLIDVYDINNFNPRGFVYCVERKKLLSVIGESITTRKMGQTHTLVPSLISPILLACGKAKKGNTRSLFLGLELKVVGLLFPVKVHAFLLVETLH